MSEKHNYIYWVDVVKVIDGDTIDVVVDLGFKSFSVQRIRLYGIDAPETRGKERADGLVSTAWLKDKLLEEADEKTGVIRVKMKSIRDKQGKYGRYLGVFYLSNGECLNKMMIAEGLAEEQYYGRKPEW